MDWQRNRPLAKHSGGSKGGLNFQILGTERNVRTLTWPPEAWIWFLIEVTAASIDGSNKSATSFLIT